MKRLAIALVLASGAARAETTRADFDVGYVHASGFLDEDGTRRALTRSYDAPGAPARSVSLDSFVISFDGRYDLGKNVSAGVSVPLVRNARSGRRSAIVGSQSLYAEGMALGDLTGNLRIESSGPVTLGVDAIVKAPLGSWDDLETRDLPTGGGDFALGVRADATLSAPMFETGLAAGAIRRMERSDGLDRGDPFFVRAWGAVRWVAVSAGASVDVWIAAADRIDGARVNALPPELAYGHASPAQQRVSIAPFVEVAPGSATRVRLTLGEPGIGTTFLPVESGWVLAGKNVIVPDLLAALSVTARF